MYLWLMVFACLLQAGSVCEASNIVYKSTNIECSGNPKRVENISCFIRALNWNKAVAEMDSYLILPLSNISIQLEAFKKSYTNQYHPFLVNVTFNLCDIFAKRNFVSYGTIFFKILGKYSNMNHTCPYKNHLFARDLLIDENLIPILPLGSYMFSLKIFEGLPNRPSIEIGVIKFFFIAMEMIKIREKKKFNNGTTIMPSRG